MDAELAAMSSVAATTLVTLMTTDGWKRVKEAFAALWRRHPGEAQAAAADLDAARLEVMAARRVGDEQAELEVLGEWRSRLRRLVAGDEGLRDELRELLQEFRAQPSGTDQTGPVIMWAEASGSARINQAGRDQTVIEG